MNDTPHGYENLYAVGEDGTFFDASTAYVEVWGKKGEDYAERTGIPPHTNTAIKRSISIVELVRFWETFKGPIPLTKEFDPDFDPSKEY